MGVKAVRAIFIVFFIYASSLSAVSFAQGQNISYDKKLTRLSEVLGSLHYLYNLCGEETTTWRDKMNSLLNAENPDDARRAKLIAAFNSGYDVFSDNYHQCTPAALSAIKFYSAEGQKISQELIARFGN